MLKKHALLCVISVGDRIPQIFIVPREQGMHHASVGRYHTTMSANGALHRHHCRGDKQHLPMCSALLY
jgi:hypothetical protein